MFTCSEAPPVAIGAPREEKVILTPKPVKEPKINGPRLFAVRPGKPFIYRIPCTGERPMMFDVDGLPNGLRVDSSMGIITGRATTKPGKYVVQL